MRSKGVSGRQRLGREAGTGEGLRGTDLRWADLVQGHWGTHNKDSSHIHRPRGAGQKTERFSSRRTDCRNLEFCFGRDATAEGKESKKFTDFGRPRASEQVRKIPVRHFQDWVAGCISRAVVGVFLIS